MVRGDVPATGDVNVEIGETAVNILASTVAGLG